MNRSAPRRRHILGFVFTIAVFSCGPTATSDDAAEIDSYDIAALTRTVNIVLMRAANDSKDPYEDTSSIRATLTYDECTSAFYSEHPEYQLNGLFGPDIFGTPQTELFDACPDNNSVCRVDSIEQSAIAISVTYTAAPHLYGKRVPFGPIPGKLISECDLATMRLAELDDITGLDSAGNQVWKVTYADPFVAIDTQDRDLDIYSTRLE